MYTVQRVVGRSKDGPHVNTRVAHVSGRPADRVGSGWVRSGHSLYKDQWVGSSFCKYNLCFGRANVTNHSRAGQIKIIIINDRSSWVGWGRVEFSVGRVESVKMDQCATRDGYSACFDSPKCHLSNTF